MLQIPERKKLYKVLTESTDKELMVGDLIMVDSKNRLRLYEPGLGWVFMCEQDGFKVIGNGLDLELIWSLVD